MRKALLLVAVAALVLPVAALSAGPTRADRVHAFGDCAALKVKLGGRTFRATYRPAAGSNRNAFGKCVSGWARTEARNRANAARACAAERANDADAFAAAYGPRRAFGRCVSQQRRAASRKERHAVMNAARKCEVARGDDADAFAEAWGTARNAFGTCVSATVRAS